MGFYLASTEAIRNARKAFDAGELQIQTDPKLGSHGHYCLYTGPCAIGVSLPEELRETLDKADTMIAEGGSISVYSAVYMNHIETDNLEVLETLQEAHDSGDIDGFRQTLESLECMILEQPSPSA